MQDAPEPQEVSDPLSLFMEPAPPTEPEEENVSAEQDTGEQTDDVQEEQLFEEEASEPEDDEGREEEVEASDDDTDDAEEEAEEAPELFTVKVDGEERQITLEDLKAGYSATEKSRQLVGEAVMRKKEAEAIFQSLQASQEQVQALVDHISQNGMVQPPQPPDPAKAQTDPMGYITAKAQYDQEVMAYQTQQQQIAQVQEQRRVAQEAAMQAHLAEQHRRLGEMIPEMADPKTAKQMQNKLFETGEAYGFTKDELAAVTDARNLKVLDDARKWRELQSGKTPGQAKPKAPPRNVKPKAKRAEPPQLKRARLLSKAKKSGDADAALSLFFDT